MAYKDSSEIATDQNYMLGDYSFRIERSSVPGSSNDKIEAICTKDGKNARKSIQIPSSTNMSNYRVEANDTTADVYALTKIRIPKGDGTASYDGTTIAFAANPSSTYTSPDGKSVYTGLFEGGTAYVMRYSDSYVSIIAYSDSPYVKYRETHTDADYPSQNFDRTYSFNSSSTTAHGKTFYWYSGNTIPWMNNWASIPYVPDSNNANYIGTILFDGTIDVEYEEVEEEVLVGRFAIELEEAGGVGPGSDWTDPGDYDPDWEPEDPTHTLYVTVTGALSGRHNDPIEDPNYSYIPADKDTVKDYGCGGDGGHGGGGGAGASTVVVHKFATNQANSKEVTAIARRHGYGSGGGKGGKGGDGCILVYY